MYRSPREHRQGKDRFYGVNLGLVVTTKVRIMPAERTIAKVRLERASVNIGGQSTDEHKSR
jgi:hypothetical protein